MVRKKDLFGLIQPLLPRLHALAMCLLPDDLQAQQLVVDTFTLCMLKEKKSWLEKQWDEEDRKSQIHLRKQFMKSLVAHMVDLGAKRSLQLWAELPDVELVRQHPKFFQLETKARAIAWLRFGQSWSVEEIEKVLGLKRFEVIEKIHNARFLMLGQPPKMNHLEAHQ